MLCFLRNSVRSLYSLCPLWLTRKDALATEGTEATEKEGELEAETRDLNSRKKRKKTQKKTRQAKTHTTFGLPSPLPAVTSYPSDLCDPLRPLRFKTSSSSRQRTRIDCRTEYFGCITLGPPADGGCNDLAVRGDRACSREGGGQRRGARVRKPVVFLFAFPPGGVYYTETGWA